MAATTSKLFPRLIIGIGGVLLFILVLHLAGVAALRFIVERELHPPLPKGTYIGDVHVNLFTGALEVDEVPPGLHRAQRAHRGHGCDPGTGLLGYLGLEGQALPLRGLLLRGAAVGALIGEIANDDAGEINRYLWFDGEPMKETLYTHPEGLSGFTWNIMPVPFELAQRFVTASNEGR